jgi:hypothetical protein
VADQKYVYGAGGGTFFVFDPQKAEIVHSVDLAVSAMVIAPNGDVVGTGGGRLFVFSPSQMQVTHACDNPLGDFTHMCVALEGLVYGINSKLIGRIVPATWQVEQIAASGGKFLASDHDGRLYFARGSHLLRLLPPESPSQE